MGEVGDMCCVLPRRQEVICRQIHQGMFTHFVNRTPQTPQRDERRIA